MSVVILDHALIKHKLSIMRDKNTSSAVFKQNLDEIAMLMSYEVTKDILLDKVNIETPICDTIGYEIKRPIVLVPILRAGLGLLDGFRRLIPEASVGHIGMYRDEETLFPHEYYANFPPHMDQSHVIVVDPMLATGGSAIDAIEAIKKRGAQKITFACLVAAPEGIEKLTKEEPDVDIVAAALDESLNEKGYIVPGLGDAGDRLFGTVDE